MRNLFCEHIEVFEDIVCIDSQPYMQMFAGENAWNGWGGGGGEWGLLIE